MDPRCRVEMLGPLQLRRGDQVLTRFGTQKAAALLAYLALRPGPQPREQVIDAFWPEMDLSAGRNNLNTALSALRHILEPVGVRKGTVLATSHAHVGLAPAAITTDVADFERLLSQAERSEEPQGRAETLCQALALWSGDFQPGNYQDWAVHEGERLSARRVEALDRQGDDLEALGRHAEAAQVTRQRVDIDPYEEVAYVKLIRRLALAGQSGAAREAASKFDRFFREEFGAPPSSASLNAVAGFLPQAGPVPDKTRRSAVARRPPVTTESVPTASGLPVPAPIRQGPSAPTLPFWLSRFFGREAEMAQLAGLLLSQKDIPYGPDLSVRPCRLVTLLGAGGAGKTRMAAEFARLAAERHGLFCVFVPLADLSAANQLPAQIAQTLRLPPIQAQAPLDQVIGFLRERDLPGAAPSLLVLDNLEHLLGADDERKDGASGQAIIETTQALLRDAPGLTVLTTSRRRLGLQGERIIPVGPLPLPNTPDDTAETDSLTELLDVPSVRLYVDRAQAVRPDFGLTAVNAPAIVALCRTLEGSPLALELAASWVRLLPPRKMWERLSQGQAMPEGRHSDLPSRHRSLSAALDWSWRLLTERQRRLLARVSVFRGGWTADSTEIVCNEPDALRLLGDLQEASLVTTAETETGETRYGLLETVRQYAGERLREDDQEAETRDRHAAYFLTVAEAAETEIVGPNQKEWLERLASEHDNVRAALDWSSERSGASETELRLAAAMGKFWSVRGHLTEGRTRLYTALARTQDAPLHVCAKALYEAGMIAGNQGDHKETQRLLEECLTIRREIGDSLGCAGPLRMLGIGARERGDFAAARTHLTESRDLYQAAGDRRGAAGTLTSLGNLALSSGDTETAQELFTQSLSMHRAMSDLRGTAVALGNQGNVSSIQGEHAVAKEQLKQCLDIYAELGDVRGCAITQQSQAVVAIKTGDDQGAISLLSECLESYRRLGDRQGSIRSLEAFVTVWARTGRCEASAHLWAAIGALHHEIGIKLTPQEQKERDRIAGELETVLGEDKFAAAKGLGQLMTWEDTVKYALQDSVPEKESTWQPR